MGDYLTHLIGRSLGQGEVLSPRPMGLFEPPPSTDSRIPPYHPYPATLEEEDTHNEAAPDSPSAVPVLTKPKGISRRSVTGVQGHLEAPSHQMDDLQPYPHQSLGQPTNLQQPRSKLLAPQSPEISTERGPSQPESNPAESKVAPITPRLTEKRSEQRLTQPDTKTTEPGPSSIVIHKIPQETGMDEPPPLVPRNMANTLPFQSTATQKGKGKRKTNPDMRERPESLKASLPTILPPEIRPTDSATMEEDLRQPSITPHIKAKEVSPKLIKKPVKESTIQVTIGRIEVRAVPPQTHTPRKERPKPNVMTLDEYLLQRDQGGHS